MARLNEKFGSSFTRSPDCGLPAHYLELQALCDEWNMLERHQSQALLKISSR